MSSILNLNKVYNCKVYYFNYKLLVPGLKRRKLKYRITQST